MPHKRTMRQILADLRECNETRNYSNLEYYIEEVYLAFRDMEDKLDPEPKEKPLHPFK